MPKRAGSKRSGREDETAPRRGKKPADADGLDEDDLGPDEDTMDMDDLMDEDGDDDFIFEDLEDDES